MPPDARFLLAFDTSAAHCAAALVSSNPHARPIATTVEPMNKGQGTRLLPLLQEVLAEAGLGWKDLGGIGVGVGPGNFTGVRISVAAARGLAMALSVPAIGVSTHAALAFDRPGIVATTVNAPRGQLYLQTFEDGRAICEISLIDPTALSPADWAHSGSLAGDWPDTVPMPVPQVATDWQERIAQLGRAAMKRHAEAKSPPKPIYLRPPDAAPAADAPPLILDDA